MVTEMRFWLPTPAGRESGLFGEPAYLRAAGRTAEALETGPDFSVPDRMHRHGNGLKDPIRHKERPNIMKLPADLPSVEKALGWG
jgi:hypothetical protein